MANIPDRSNVHYQMNLLPFRDVFTDCKIENDLAACE